MLRTQRSHYSLYLQMFLAHNIITNTKCSEKNNSTSLSTQPNPTQPMDGPNPCPSLWQRQKRIQSALVFFIWAAIISPASTVFFVYRATLLCILARPSARFAGMQAILYIQFVKQRPPLSRIAPLPCVYLPHYLIRGSLGRS